MRGAVSIVTNRGEMYSCMAPRVGPRCEAGEESLYAILLQWGHDTWAASMLRDSDDEVLQVTLNNREQCWCNKTDAGRIPSFIGGQVGHVNLSLARRRPTLCLWP